MAQETNKKIKFLAKVETRNSFVQTHHVTMLGVRAGFEFKFPVRCGIGYYWMLTNIDSKFYNPSDFGQTDPTAQPKMRYAIGYVDYSFYKEDDWTLSVPVQIGVGETYYRSSESDRFANGLIVPMEAGVAVDYLFTNWVGFGVGLGYRVMLKGNKQLWTLLHLKYHKHILADNGINGSSANKTGADGKDITVEVPLGTVAKDAETGEVLFEITEHDETQILVNGGRGGLGNTNFKSSTNQTPRYAQPGEPGE